MCSGNNFDGRKRRNRNVEASHLIRDPSFRSALRDQEGRRSRESRDLHGLHSFRSGRDTIMVEPADTLLRRPQRNRVAPARRRNITPVMTAPYFSKVPLRG
ncbi:hypothetical protein PUN28_015074 [Cardiocondyla obscurior]|uniref:Uncharacterized protein n=1 Tax=Cardiocondyla obscurior TaxID=286306 RepID=A0AAW2F0E7_9HYME